MADAALQEGVLAGEVMYVRAPVGIEEDVGLLVGEPDVVVLVHETGVVRRRQVLLGGNLQDGPGGGVVTEETLAGESGEQVVLLVGEQEEDPFSGNEFR